MTVMDIHEKSDNNRTRFISVGNRVKYPLRGQEGKRLKENISFDDKKVNLSLTTFPQVNLWKLLVPLYSHGPSTILTTLILLHFAPN